MKPIARALDQWFGRGEASITDAADGRRVPAQRSPRRGCGCARSAGGPTRWPSPSRGLLVSLGRSLKRVDKLEDGTAASFDTDISALTGLPDGGAAAGLVDGRIVFVGGRNDGRTIDGQRCMTALAPARDGALFVANGSAAHAPAEWKRDLMEKRPSGSVWRLDLATGERSQLAGELAYPNGLVDEGGAPSSCRRAGAAR